MQSLEMVHATPFHEMPLPKLVEVVDQLVPFQVSASALKGLPEDPVAMQAVGLVQSTASSSLFVAVGLVTSDQVAPFHVTTKVSFVEPVKNAPTAAQ
jgi:hypothetical protein